MQLRFALLLLTSYGLARAGPAAAQVTQSMDDLLERLASPDWRIRYGAYSTIDAHPQNWAAPAAARALMQLVKREDSNVVAVNHEPRGKNLDSLYGDGEGYAEYTSDVLDRCLKVCGPDVIFAYLFQSAMDFPDLRRERVDLFQNLYADPRFSPAQRSAIHSTFVVAAADPTSFLTRESALRAIGFVLRSGVPSPSDRRRLHQAVIVAAHDWYTDVRLVAVRLLSDLRDSADLPVLRRIAAEDTARVIKNGVAHYPVREEAKLAMAGICGLCKSP